MTFTLFRIDFILWREQLAYALLKKMDDALAEGPWLAGGAFSLADAAVIPYILRLDLLKMARIWEKQPRIAAWYARMRERPSVKKELLDRMTLEDHAPFKNLQPDPWPKVSALLAAA